ncbi:hypothetical protein ACO3_510200 [Thiomonas arsenitoxydans]|nr:hypothetical protein ACO3_510200 [Thiomonas arsenitoxydans]
MISKPAALGTENERSGGAPCSRNRLIGPEVARPKLLTRINPRVSQTPSLTASQP